ncbi:MAG: hypothetical protein JSV88_24985 [Candidatus Aminicenantes bacterium]|nr:MAG: hypothetical protein JSV88_24985 [Candidatus Aminicenantes bacterium]
MKGHEDRPLMTADENDDHDKSAPLAAGGKVTVSLIIVLVSISWVIFTVGAKGLNPWQVFILRNLLVLALMAWSMIWYASAFTYLQKEVYKR